MNTPATNDAVARVATDYSEILAEPLWEKRQSKLKTLKEYAQQLKGREREILITYFPDLFNPTK